MAHIWAKNVYIFSDILISDTNREIDPDSFFENP